MLEGKNLVSSVGKNINRDRHGHQQEAKALLSLWASLYIDHPLKGASQSGEDRSPSFSLFWKYLLAWILNVQFKGEGKRTYAWLFPGFHWTLVGSHVNYLKTMLCIFHHFLWKSDGNCSFFLLHEKKMKCNEIQSERDSIGIILQAVSAFSRSWNHNS